MIILSLRTDAKNTAKVNFTYFFCHQLCRNFEERNLSHIKSEWTLRMDVVCLRSVLQKILYKLNFKPN
jgi:hypothetical protein